MTDLDAIKREQLDNRLSWKLGDEIGPHIWFGGYVDKGLGVIFETDQWCEMFRMLFIDFLGKHIFRSKGSDILIVVRKIKK